MEVMRWEKVARAKACSGRWVAREWRREREKRPSGVCRRVGTEEVMAREERVATVRREVMRLNTTAAWRREMEEEVDQLEVSVRAGNRM